MASSDQRQVTFVLFDDCVLLDLAGPLDVFHTVSTLGSGPGYRLVTASPDGGPVRCDSGVSVSVDTALSAPELAASTDTMIVVGGPGVDAFAANEEAMEQLARLSRRARRTGSVCTGAFALAAAGLLDGCSATTHWAYGDRLARRYPNVVVDSDRIFARDRDRWTSAGVTAGIDLALALVEDDFGVELSHAIAGALVVFARRPGGQTQFSTQLRHQTAKSTSVAEIQRWLPDHLGERITVETLAERAQMSPRTFARVFRRETGTTPGAYVEQLRIEAAQRLLITTALTLPVVAQRVGLGRVEILHRAFLRRVGTTPGRYRDHFAVASAS
ncbi:DJ-1/PfpI family protein [Actinomadura fulvescens]|uniref:GlxA family transcriptional regulator n=1 Tax=Actinomadura fulvescens TaxID=46160 RepID=A0ABP6CV34_9ACTN